MEDQIKVPVAASQSQEAMYEEPNYSEEISLKKLDHIPRGIKTARVKTKKGLKVLVKTLGSAGEPMQIDAMKIREMSDPYNYTIRKQFTDSAYQDPTLSAALQKRNNAFFANGFQLKFELKSKTKKNGQQDTGLSLPSETQTDISNFPQLQIQQTPNPSLGSAGPEQMQMQKPDPIQTTQTQPQDQTVQDESQMTPEEVQTELNQYYQKYSSILQKIQDWCDLPQINILEKMKRAHISTIVQGRSLILIIPGIPTLPAGQMPPAIRVITWQDTGNVIVDTIFWKPIAIRLFFLNKSIALPEEMIYIVGKNWGLRRESDYYGASEFEAFLQLSRINRKVLNYDIAKAAEAGYITKIILTMMTGGDQDTRQQQIQNVVNQIISQGTDVIGLETGATVTPVPITVDSPMIEMIVRVLDDRLLNAAGATRAQMGRTENLNRDTATVMEIENIRNIRTPDELLIKTPFENQLLNPLFAHLAGVKFEELPVRIVIDRIDPEDEASAKEDEQNDSDEMTDPLMEKKLLEMTK